MRHPQLVRSAALALFIVALPSLALSQDNEGEKQNYRGKYEVSLWLELNTGFSDYRPVFDKDYKKLFLPIGGIEELDTKARISTLGIRPVFAIALHRGKINVTLPISYRIADWSLSEVNDSTPHGLVSLTTIDWWDRVIAGDVVSSHFSPRVGLAMTFGRIEISPSIQHYQLKERRYRGIDCVGCGNSSEVYESKVLESGVSPRIEFVWLARGFGERKSDYAPDPVFNGLSVAYERVGSKYWRLSIALRMLGIELKK
ncbi:MAG: hypothetical protein UW46_C0005G0014 [Candidatus Yanofskybacteria bacterium GW2011_GWF1_44_227]|uniref:Outer membrane protein beta-barrel domain-containing protein n=1 Tax=Candidatus Yanofskybacteria bacterium GW2011_GWE2_40_11 TaxID=1619033 RepID=A0A0G0TSX2_9BACT|nr:MAG: hypothetical protein UT69_C0010G0029 [Candidatus Yanofskybacteria bacterium GW2011_GWE1_40_10]KKR40977.1 MAG: hypothetical protein UT75_C0002G0014 [Candidatus Yanofskybacteria bacterium GW2011_GWE2_40_11]KKT15543.1 MAG: hypothetical protein UV97_C0005G0036 [Candidatus Yanofskybacteria bacterium GW2011_GWF2_43_596]KKT53208.1 MAG: hypothetical protein UW46_C0005G0014 [Candidatus Yanofskybacteria bacterium GW2011_GWF1_44_227]OGN35581.1 MAG: hypothetical protein A2207_02480 [Candidatus Yano